MLLLLELLLLELLLLLYVFYHVLTRGREAPPHNYVVKSMILFKTILARILKSNLDFFSRFFCQNIEK